MVGARWYDPAIGSWTQEDPARADGNFYGYCGGDTINRWDPSGLCYQQIQDKGWWWETWQGGSKPTGGGWYEVHCEAAVGTMIDQGLANEEWWYIGDKVRVREKLCDRGKILLEEEKKKRGDDLKKDSRNDTEVITNLNLKLFNCASYAFGISDRAIHPACSFKSYYTVEEVLNDVINKNWKDDNENPYTLRGTFRKLNSQNSVLRAGEYMIAMRVATGVNPYTGIGIVTADYHFWKQNPNTGVWYNKHGKVGYLQSLAGCNPDSALNRGWYLGDPNFMYYNSKTLYVAFKPSSGGFWIS